jgi:hypothetical protein
MAIELTSEQRQAILAHPGGPIDVIDPTTQRIYVLVAREEYEKGRAFQRADPPEEERQQAALAVPQCLADLPTPAEVADAVKRSYTRWRKLGGKSLATIEEELKLQYYYGGQSVNYLRTPRGIVVMAVGHCGTSDYRRQLDALPAELRPQLLLAIPSRWNDEVAEILTPHDHES